MPTIGLLLIFLGAATLTEPLRAFVEAAFAPSTRKAYRCD